MPVIRLTPAVKVLLVACFAIFIVQQTADLYFGTHLLNWFALIPADVVIHHRIWQVFTYSFLHADVMHLFFNLLLLAFIGGDLEDAWGTAKFLRFYFFCATAAGLFYLFLQLFVWRGNIPMVGASGALYGLLIAYGLIFGERVLLFMLLFPMKAKHFVWILVAVEFLTTAFSSHGALSSLAHLGGMAAGFGYLWGKATWNIYRRRRKEDLKVRERQRRRKASNHLKLVINNFDPRSPKRPGVDDDSDSDTDPKTWH